MNIRKVFQENPQPEKNACAVVKYGVNETTKNAENKRHKKNPIKKALKKKHRFCQVFFSMTKKINKFLENSKIKEIIFE